MPRLPQERDGIPLQIKQQTVKFSFWPTRKKQRSFTPQAEILTKNAWESIELAITRRFKKGAKQRDVCLSFLAQANDFYTASESSQRAASRPLLLYYCLLNLAKAFIVFRGIASQLDSAGHGVSEDRKPYRKATIRAQPTSAKSPQVFDLLSQALGERPLSRMVRFQFVKDLLPQIVIGHRLWAEAAAAAERFVRVEHLGINHDPNMQSIWLSIDIKRADLRGLQIGHQVFLRYSGLKRSFREVSPKGLESAENSNEIVRFEQLTPIKYTRRPSDVLHKLPNVVSESLWCILRSVPPYRRYYLWASPNLARKTLHPLLSVYLIIFFLGSVTRYRPYYFSALEESPYGTLLHEIIQTQGPQMLFHLAAAFNERDISWPAVI